MKVTVFDGKGETIRCHQHIEADMPLDVRVVVRASADRQEVLDTLLRIAAYIDLEDARARSRNRLCE